MEQLLVRGGRPLEGSIAVNGAKNSVLPILAATLLNGRKNVLHHCPDLRDVDSAVRILRHLGCVVTREGTDITVDSGPMNRCDVPHDLMREMRSSVIFLGPIIARCGKARLSTPGGCELGPRPIDLHLAALARLGVRVEEEDGDICCTAEDMRGTDLCLSFPSVGATENAMLAATACTGVTRIVNAAREPEIADLQEFLKKAGCRVEGGGTGEIAVSGGNAWLDTEHTVLPDRIEAATFLCAAAACGGDVQVTDCEPAHLMTVIESLNSAGCRCRVAGRTVRLERTGALRAMPPVRTMPYPGFPTDAQAPLMAAACLCEGTTLFVENVFEDRYRHTAELARMGAQIRVVGRTAMVTGVPGLHGAEVRCTDLRGGAALVLAALAAEGETRISEIAHIERGYAHLAPRLHALGAEIVRTED